MSVANMMQLSKCIEIQGGDPLVSQKDYILQTLNIQGHGEAIRCLDYVMCSWVQQGYGYKATDICVRGMSESDENSIRWFAWAGLNYRVQILESKKPL